MNVPTKQELELRLEELAREEATIRRILKILEDPEFAEALSYLAAMERSGRAASASPAPLLTLRKTRYNAPEPAPRVSRHMLERRVLDILVSDGPVPTSVICEKITDVNRQAIYSTLDQMKKSQKIETIDRVHHIRRVA